MRDRLIELIDNFIHCVNVKEWYSEELDEKLADYLIENGVIVPPCKVGEVLFTIDNQEITITQINVFIKRYNPISYTFESQYTINNGIYPYFFSEYEIGKTVFLTKEEAEKALRG